MLWGHSGDSNEYPVSGNSADRHLGKGVTQTGPSIKQVIAWNFKYIAKIPEIIYLKNELRMNISN